MEKDEARKKSKIIWVVLLFVTLLALGLWFLGGNHVRVGSDHTNMLNPGLESVEGSSNDN